MKRLVLVCLIVLAAVLLPTSSAVAADPGMPNVIFVMADSPEPSSMLVSPMQAADPGVVKVVFLQADSATDNGWNAASWRGIQELGKLGVVTKTGDYSFDVALVSGGILEVKTVTNIGYNAGDIERVARSVVENGANMVVGTWFDSAFALAMLAEEYPDVKFVHISGYPVVKSNGRNFSTYFAKQEQADYAVCAAIARAGLHKVGKGVGMVATQPIPEPIRAVNWCLWGMQDVDPTATLKVIWIHSWLNQQDEMLAAEALIAEGYGVIRQLADTPYSSEVACAAGISAVGYGTDVSCAQITNEWNWGPAYLSEIKSLLAGTWKSQDRWEGFETGAMRLTGPLAKSVQDIVDKFATGTFDPSCGRSGKALLADGTYQTITDAPCLTPMDQLTMQWLGDGYTGEYPTLAEPVTFGK